MPKALLKLIASFLMLSTANAGLAKAASFESKWRSAFSGTDSTGLNAEAKTFEFKTDLKASYILNDQLYFFVFPSLRLQAGQTVSADKDQKSENKIILREATINYKADSWFEFAAGALDQNERHASIFISERAFPGARAGLNLINSENYKLQTSVEGSIPTSSGLSSNTTEVEQTPTFSNVQIRFEKSGLNRGNIFLGYYAFQNLPSSVASDSAALGNSVYSLSQTDYRFNYTYGGFELGAEYEYNLTANIKPAGRFYTAVNTGAPEDSNKLYYGRAGVEFKVNPNFAFAPYGGMFRTESDSTVASFNALQFQGTNRNGYIAGVELYFRKLNFFIRSEYTESNVIYLSPTQDRDRAFRIRLETYYAKI